MLYRLLSDSAICTLISFADKGLAMIVFFIIGQRISVADIGRADLTLGVVLIVAALGGMELYQAVMRLFFDQNKDHSIKALFSTALISNISISSIFSLLVILFSNQLSSCVLGSGDHRSFFIAGALWSLGYSLNSLFSVMLRAQALFRRVAVMMFVRIVSQLSAVYIVVFKLAMGGESILWSQCFGFAVSGGFGAWYCRRQIGFDFNLSVFRKMMKFSSPLIVSAIAGIASQYCDRAITQSLLSPKEVGLLGTGARIANVILVFSSGFAMALSPIIYEAHHRSELKAKIAILLRGFLVLGLVAVVGLSVLAPALIKSYMRPEYHDAGSLVPILSCGQVCSQLYLFAPGLIISKKTKLFAAMQCLGMLVSLVLGPLLSKHYGLTGITYAGLVAQLASVVLIFAFGQKFYPIPLNFNRLIALIAIYVATITFYSHISFVLCPLIASIFTVLAITGSIFVGFSLSELKSIKDKFSGLLNT